MSNALEDLYQLIGAEVLSSIGHLNGKALIYAELEDSALSDGILYEKRLESHANLQIFLRGAKRVDLFTLGGVKKKPKEQGVEGSRLFDRGWGLHFRLYLSRSDAKRRRYA
jgi:hypothetical protein